MPNVVVKMLKKKKWVKFTGTKVKSDQPVERGVSWVDDPTIATAFETSDVALEFFEQAVVFIKNSSEEKARKAMEQGGHLCSYKSAGPNLYIEWREAMTGLSLKEKRDLIGPQSAGMSVGELHARMLEDRSIKIKLPVAHDYYLPSWMEATDLVALLAGAPMSYFAPKVITESLVRNEDLLKSMTVWFVKGEPGWVSIDSRINFTPSIEQARPHFSEASAIQTASLFGEPTRLVRASLRITGVKEVPGVLKKGFDPATLELGAACEARDIREEIGAIGDSRTGAARTRRSL